MPKTFWERSLFVETRAIAAMWFATPVRGISIRSTICGFKDVHQWVRTILPRLHHELGHNFYQRAYDQQPFLFRATAQTTVPRSHWRHDRFVGDAGIFEEDRAAAYGAG